MPSASHIFSRPLSACPLFCSIFCFLLAAQISVFKLKQNTLNLTLLKNPIGRLGASLIHCRLFVHCVEQLCEQVRSVRLTRIDSASQSLFILIGLCLNFGQPYCQVKTVRFISYTSIRQIQRLACNGTKMSLKCLEYKKSLYIYLRNTVCFAGWRRPLVQNAKYASCLRTVRLNRFVVNVQTFLYIMVT